MKGLEGMKYLKNSDFMINIVFYHFVDMNASQETHCDNAYKLQPIQIHTWHSQPCDSEVEKKKPRNMQT